MYLKSVKRACEQRRSLGKTLFPGIDRAAFQDELYLMVHPSYQSAQSQGFAEWKK